MCAQYRVKGHQSFKAQVNMIGNAITNPKQTNIRNMRNGSSMFFSFLIFPPPRVPPVTASKTAHSYY